MSGWILVLLIFGWIGAFAAGCALALGAYWFVDKFIHEDK
jgi:hypothetical protein